MDNKKIMDGVRMILEGIGEDPSREGLIDTPKRVANMCHELFSGLNDDPKLYLSKTFSCANQKIVLVKDIPFYSICEHHLLPFFGKISVAYIPKDYVVGLSKIVRTIECFSKRLQIQERMTEEISNALYTYLDIEGVAVYVEAEHLCMTMRGIKANGTTTVTISTKGIFDNYDNEMQFLNMINKN